MELIRDKKYVINYRGEKRIATYLGENQLSILAFYLDKKVKTDWGSMTQHAFIDKEEVEGEVK